MYSYEEWIKAVMLYIQYDFKATVAIRELGYPSERMLRYWYNEYEISHALHKELEFPRNRSHLINSK